MARGCIAAGMASTSSARFSSTCPSASMTSDIGGPLEASIDGRIIATGPSYIRLLLWRHYEQTAEEAKRSGFTPAALRRHEDMGLRR
jgi:hypothetical protein